MRKSEVRCGEKKERTNKKKKHWLLNDDANVTFRIQQVKYVIK